MISAFNAVPALALHAAHEDERRLHGHRAERRALSLSATLALIGVEVGLRGARLFPHDLFLRRGLTAGEQHQDNQITHKPPFVGDDKASIYFLAEIGLPNVSEQFGRPG